MAKKRNMPVEQLAQTPNAVQYGYNMGRRAHRSKLPELTFGDYSMPGQERRQGGHIRGAISPDAAASERPGRAEEGRSQKKRKKGEYAAGAGASAAASGHAHFPSQRAPSERAAVNRDLGDFYLNATSGMFSEKAGGKKKK